MPNSAQRVQRKGEQQTSSASLRRCNLAEAVNKDETSPPRCGGGSREWGGAGAGEPLQQQPHRSRWWKGGGDGWLAGGRNECPAGGVQAEPREGSTSWLRQLLPPPPPPPFPLPAPRPPGSASPCAPRAQGKSAGQTPLTRFSTPNRNGGPPKKLLVESRGGTPSMFACMEPPFGWWSALAPTDRRSKKPFGARACQDRPTREKRGKVTGIHRDRFRKTEAKCFARNL